MYRPERQLINGSYLVLETLFENNVTQISLAERVSDSVKVIIKKSLETEAHLPGASKTGHEFDILKSLKHEGIPKVYEIFYEGGAFSLIEEYIDGHNLKEQLFKGRIGIAEVLNIAVQLAGILYYIHQQGVIHKDINPRNIIRGKNGTVKLIDFAISSNLNSRTNEMLNIDQIEGSLSYISPEQTGRTAFSVAPASDFYSLGIVLYELLAGKPPFDSIDPLEVIHFHLSRNPTTLSTILPDLPVGLEQVIAKLMQKNPDDRYQSAAGLKADLETIQGHYLSKTPLTGFKAGSKDVFGHYKQSQKLYGRENEIDQLLRYYRDLNELKSILVLVSGYSGVGKSALIRHVKFPIIQSNGIFLSGKFDQFKKDIPYYGFIEAVQDFIKNLLSEPEEKIVYWRQRIIAVLGENAGLITEVIPQLSKIVKKQDAVPKLQPAEQEARFNMVLLDFIYVFSSVENPLVLFLDDLQWADLSSLNLVKRIIQNPRQENIMILGAYRDNEVEKGHPLMITKDQIDKSTGQLKTLHLKPLDRATTCRITADSFAMRPEQAREIGQKVFTKTKGNPFFTHNFLKSLFDKKIIKAGSNGEWTWSPEEIDALGYTDNVIDLMTEGLTLLQRETQEILKYAAVLGNKFYLADLNNIIEKPPSQIYLHLKPAIKEGYLISNDKSFRALALSSINDDFDAEQALLNNSVFFTFGHDKVQQAAYGLITGDENASVNLKIGRLLLQSRSGPQLQEGIFELLNLFAQGVHLIEDNSEKIRITELCLTAGRKAKDSTSYALGVRFLGMGKVLLGAEGWADNYRRTYNTLLELGECEYLNNNPTRAEAYFREILTHSKSNFDKLKVYYLHSSLYLKIGNTAKSMQLGLDAMKLYDIRFPKGKKAIQATTLWTLAKYLVLFSTKYRNPKNLLRVEDCEDEERIAINKFLIDLATSAYQQDQHLMMLVCFEIIKSYLKNGFTDASGFGFSGFSVVVLSSLKLQKRGFKLWDLTIKLHKKTHSPLIKWRLSYTVLSFNDPWRMPFRASYDNILETLKACVLNGDQIFTGYTAALYIRTRITAGENLGAIVESSTDHLALINNGKGGLDFFLGFYQLAKALNGQTDPETWNDASFDGEKTLRRLKREGNNTKLAFYHVSKCALFYFFGNYSEALDQSGLMLKYADNVLGDVVEAWHAFYTCLSISATYDNCSSREKKIKLKKFNKHLKDIKQWARGCPENYGQHYVLLMAELNVMQNKPEKAIHYYERAIKSAAQYNFTYVEAIANENAALVCKKMQFDKRAKSYVNDAWEAYKVWGAVVKCKQLERDYPDVLIKKAQPIPHLKSVMGASTTVSSKTALDLASVLKASQSIAGQVKYHDLLKMLMHIIIENAGAEKGCFLRYKENGLHIEAKGISGKEGIEILPSIPMEESDLIPRSFINYCWRTGESAVLDDAQKEARFNTDPYIRDNKTLSAMCLPIAVRGQVNGLLYLENSMLKGVFDKNRITLPQMLSGQIGISIENALLYENLEEKVAERTHEIEKTRDELRAAQAQLIQSEKMASLGELTAGIAHEIQNPLNFVNNFAEVSKELLEEMKQEISQGNPQDVQEIMGDVIQNLEKIKHHGKRAEAIVKGMLQHSRGSSDTKKPTDINALCDEYLRLAYHGLRAKDKNFNATLETDYDGTIGKIEIVPQDIGRVVLNLITNAFYVVNEKKAAFLPAGRHGAKEETENDYMPTVWVSTKKKGNEILISVRDNGNGIPLKVIDKIFQPFFTTKPTGQGTGLGLSLSYDIVKAHGGELKVKTKEGWGSEFTIWLKNSTQ